MFGADQLVAGVWAGLAWNGDGHLPLLIAGTVGLIAALGMGLFGNRLNTSISVAPTTAVL